MLSWLGALIRLSKVVARAGTDAPIISATAANEAADKTSLEAMYMPPHKCDELCDTPNFADFFY